MAEQHDFWLQLHQLTLAYRSMGATPEEREVALATEFTSKAPPAQKAATEQLMTMAFSLANLHSRVSQTRQ